MSIVVDKICRHVCSILINRPNKRNALNLTLIKGLQEALNRFQDDDSLHVAILAGTGGNFSSGYDLNEIIDPSSHLPNMDNIEQMLWPIGTSLCENKITIAAIEGHAAGFGFELALKCHFRVASRDSRMGFMNRRFAIPIMNGGTVMLPKLVGFGPARELVATGKAQLATEAIQQGVLTYMSDVGCAVGKSLNLARCLAKFNQQSLVHDMKNLSNNYNQIDIEMLKLERSNGLEYLKKCSPLEMAGKFLTGQGGRHGSFDMGNTLAPEPDVTL